MAFASQFRPLLPFGCNTMASPQLENGYTKIANELLEKLSLPGINGSEFRILLLIIRKTYGFNKKKDRISLSQFQKFTSMNNAQAIRTIKSLVSKRILIKENNIYKLNKNWEEWLVSKRSSIQKDTIQMDNSGSIQKDTLVVSKRIDTKERFKETITKEIATPSVADKINPLIELFKPINPSYKRFYANTTQRACLDRLIKENGLEQIEWILKVLPKTNTMQYAPVITTPQQLENKIGQLKAFVLKEKSKLENKLPIIAKI
jgi:phage replication O-like protein O